MHDTSMQLEVSLNATRNNLKERQSIIEALECEVKSKTELITRLENDLKNNNDDVLEENDKNLINQGISKSVVRNECSQIIVDETDERNHYCTKVRTLEDIIEEKEKRIVQLEDGLRDTVQISTEREHVLQKEEAKRRQIMEKVSRVDFIFFIFWKT